MIKHFNSALRGNVYETRIEMEAPTIDSKVKIVEISDLHLWTEEMLGEENLELIIMMIEELNPDVILISGDIINDTKDLQNPKFRNKLIELFRKLTAGRLCVVEKGNHDGMTLIGKKWKEDENDLLKETLSSLENVVFLDEIVNLYLQDNPSLKGKGFLQANINFVGGNLPSKFYLTDNESTQSFIAHFNKRFNNGGNNFIENAFNILSMHALGNFVELCKKTGYLDEYLSKIDIGTAGHNHFDLVPPMVHPYLPGHRGLVSPNMKLGKDYHRGVVDLDGKPILLGGAVNVRVETPIINKLYGSVINVINLMPTKTKGNPKYLVRHETHKFR